MFSRKLWLFLSTLLLVWAGWHATGTVEIVYGERYLNDGTLYVSSVVCGTGPGMVFTGTFDDDVPGPATQADCLRGGRTQVAEVAGLILMAAAFVSIGFRFGREPPRPIHLELPDLPKGERVVHGRRTPSQSSK